MSDEVKLLPCCPFCGGERTKMDRLNTACYFVECQQCGAKGPEAATYEEAIAAWNTRAIEATRPTDMEIRDAE